MTNLKNFQELAWHYGVRPQNKGRSKCRIKILQPQSDSPHSVFAVSRDDRIFKYTTFDENPALGGELTIAKRFDAFGLAHWNEILEEYVPTPHIHEPAWINELKVRPVRSDEIPGSIRPILEERGLIKYL